MENLDESIERNPIMTHDVAKQPSRPERRRARKQAVKFLEAMGGDPEIADCLASGHRDQMVAYALHGTPPHPCPKCGATPEFEWKKEETNDEEGTLPTAPHEEGTAEEESQEG